jgi:nicotinate phosphoribosyltransferase
VIDFAMDIVEIEGEPKAKRGKRSGVKQVYAKKSGEHIVLPASRKGPKGALPMIENFIRDGKVMQDSWMQEARLRVLSMRTVLPAPATGLFMKSS